MSLRSTITGWVLRPVVSVLGVLSRAGVPFSNRLMVQYKPCNRSQEPIILDFRSQEGKASIQRWYDDQAITRFTSLEYRKDTAGTFKHEFIVVHLEGGLCRFDRRAREDTRGHALKDRGTFAEDSAHVIQVSSPQWEHGDVLEPSEVILRIDIPNGEDLRLVLAVCCGIQTHPEAVSYSLLRYNCYFFCWTIVTAVTRYASNWEQAAAPEAWDGVVQASLQFISPMPSTPKLSKRKQMKSWLANLGRAQKPSARDVDQGESSKAYFRDELQIQLKASRHFVADTLRELLLQSQLAHRLGEQMRRHSTDAWLKARATAAQESARAASMRHVSDARSKPKEPEKYGVLTWQKHCDIAWAVASEAAFAAASAEENNVDRTRGPVGVVDAAGNLQNGETEWDRIWDEYWKVRIPPESFNNHNKELGVSASRRGKEAWREAWNIATKLGNQHLAQIAENVASILIERLGQLETAQRIHVTGDENLLNNAGLQTYIRKRMSNHFEMVDQFGFGVFAEMLDHAEGSMCDIWRTAIDELKHGRFDY